VITVRRRLVVMLVGAVLAASGCSVFERDDDSGALIVPPPPLEVGEGEVLVAQTTYTPAEITVAVGGTVTWLFEDGGVAHTVTADDGSFNSERRTSGRFERQFTGPGQVHYHCEVHAAMKGTVDVTG
jgi:plastocyanin